MRTILNTLAFQLAHATVFGLAFMAAMLVLIGLYVHVLRSAIERGPLLAHPPIHTASISKARCGGAPPGKPLSAACLRSTRQTALR